MTKTKRFVALPQKKDLLSLVGTICLSTRFGEDFHKNNKASVVFFGRCPSPRKLDKERRKRSSVKQLLLMKRMKKPSKPQYLKVHISFWQILND